MGCLCTKEICGHQKTVTRRATYSSAREFGDVSFEEFSCYRKFKSEYKLLPNPIGSGLLGQVYLCRQILTNKAFAVKIISKAGLPADYLKKHVIETQIKIMQEVDHPSIVKIVDFFDDARNFYLIMEYVKGGDLLNKIDNCGRFSEQLAANVMKQIFSALAYLHAKGIVHRDIKCDNILIEEHNKQVIVKLIDFDTITKLNTGEKLKGVYGTVYYMSPELISGTYTEKCDIWSAGIILYTLITQNFPFGGETEEIIMRSITNYKVDLNLMTKHKISFELSDFISKLINPNPDKRLSAKAAIKHPWITKFNNPPIPINLNLSAPGFESSLKQGLKIWALKTIVPPIELAECHLMFISLDQDFDGALKIGELGNNLDSETCQRIMKIADCNLNGVLEYHEFASLVVSSDVIRRYSEQIIAELDVNRSGRLPIRHLVSFLENFIGVSDWFNNVDLEAEITNEEILKLMCN